MSKARPVADQAARDLIRTRLDINLLVEAGAGSGKTECLAQRMAAGVLEGRYKVEAMAAVTFTRKAAAELRGRFQLTLERALAAEQNETRRHRAQQAQGVRVRGRVEDFVGAALLHDVWGHRSAFTRTVDVHVAMLRQRLEDHPQKPRYILTVFGVGYKFNDES